MRDDTLDFTHERGTWYDPQAGAAIDQGDLLQRAAQSQAVLLGETHNIAEIHRWQLHVTAALHSRQPGLAVGFEMFPRRLQAVLDSWVAGNLSTEDFLADVTWFEVWGFDPELYLPLFHFCRQQRVPMLALNCERSLLKRVRQDGWAAIPEGERDGVSPSKPATEAYRLYLNNLMSSFSETGAARPMDTRFDGFVAAQQVWDRAFACNIARALQTGVAPLVVGIIGRGHLEFGHGTPFQLHDLGIDRQTVLLTTGPNTRAADLRQGIADAVFKLDAPEPPSAQPFKLGATWQRGELVVATLEDGSMAREIGLDLGDRLRSIAGCDVASQSEALAILRRVQPGSLVPLSIERNGNGTEIMLPIPYPKFVTG